VGEAIALQLASEGADGVSVVGRSLERGEGVVKKLESLGAKGLFIKCSMDVVEEVKNVVPRHEEVFGVASGLVNSAGDTGRGWLKDQTVER